MNEHRGIRNRLLWMQRAYGLTADDAVLQKTPYSFDVSVWELFWPLMVGARLVIARPEGHRDPRYLAEEIEAEGVTTLHFVPSMLAVFLDVAGSSVARTGSVRRVICSGEALPATLADRFFERFPSGVALENLYGPTEAAVDVTAWTCVPGATRVPIGRPIDNVRIYILDERLSPVPIGVAGELYIGGVQVGRGYLDRPELTAERFVRDPFASDGQGRLYRTGDLARWLPAGAIEYLGRVDLQVKLRGFRIELGEIEAALGEHAAVQRAVVVAREDTPGDKRLVAYVVPADGAARDASAELRDAPRGQAAGVHGAVGVRRARRPAAHLQRQGRSARAARAGEATSAEVTFVAPRTPTEEVLAGVWAEVLGTERVGAHDDFFALGGHSLLGMRVIVRVSLALGVELPLRALFEARTVAELGGTHRTARSRGERSAIPPLTPVPRDAAGGNLPLSFAQQRLWFLDQLEPVSPMYNIPVALRLAGPLDAAALARSFAEIVRRHEALRTTFARSGARRGRSSPPRRRPTRSRCR